MSSDAKYPAALIRDPVTVVQKSAAKKARQADTAKTIKMFTRLVGALAALFVLGFLVFGGGPKAFADFCLTFASTLQEMPVLGAAIMLALGMLLLGVHTWRHRNDPPTKRTMPAFPPVPDLRSTDDLYVASSWTREGHMPGDVIGPDVEIIDPHIIIERLGVFGNVQIKGAIGSGKTSRLIMNMLDQIVSKYPKPYPPESFALGPNGRYADGPIIDAPVIPIEEADPFDRRFWNPYVGQTIEEARAKYAELLDQHQRRKWGAFIVDAKGDITRFVLQLLVAAGRELDGVVLRPDGYRTYNPLTIAAEAQVMAEMVFEGIEAVTGRTTSNFYRQVGSEWLGYALAIQKAVNPARVTMRTVLTMARNEEMRSSWVSEAKRVMREYEEQENRLRRLGKPYHGPRVDPASIEFFESFDNPDADEQKKRDTVAAIQAQGKYFVSGALANFLCPELPQTFRGFIDAIDKGKIVIMQMPIEKWGPVGQVQGILTLMDAQQAILSRIGNPHINQERVFPLVVDEFAQYANSKTKEYLSMGRQAMGPVIMAHQSQAQLGADHDRYAETFYNDNMRTKISMAAPHAEAARRDASIFGSRRIMKERYSESASFQGVKREDGGSYFKAKGGETKSASVTLEEVERAWFNAEEIALLKTGEGIIAEFDGTANLPPRKFVAEAYYATPRGRRILAISVEEPVGRPHPVVSFQGDVRDEKHLDSLLGMSGFVVVEPLRDSNGQRAGLKLVTEAGTGLLSTDRLRTDPLMGTKLADLLSESSRVVALVEPEFTAPLLDRECGVTFENVLSFAPALDWKPADGAPPLGDTIGAPSDSRADFHRLVRSLTGRQLSYGGKGSWEYHLDRSELREWELVQDGWAIISAYAKLGHAIYELGDAKIEEFLEAMRAEVQNTVAAPVQTLSVPAANDPQKPEQPTPTLRLARVADDLGAGSAPPAKGSSAKPRKPRAPRKKVAPKPNQIAPADRKRTAQTLFDFSDVLAPTPFDPPPAPADPAPAEPDVTSPDDRPLGGGDPGADRGPELPDTPGPVTDDFDGASDLEDWDLDASWPPEDGGDFDSESIPEE